MARIAGPRLSRAVAQSPSPVSRDTYLSPGRPSSYKPITVTSHSRASSIALRPNRLCSSSAARIDGLCRKAMGCHRSRLPRIHVVAEPRSALCCLGVGPIGPFADHHEDTCSPLAARIGVDDVPSRACGGELETCINPFRPFAINRCKNSAHTARDRIRTDAMKFESLRSDRPVHPNA